MNPDALPPSARLFQMLTGVWLSKPLQVITQLKIPDLLAAGPMDAAELAQATDTHAPTLYRVLRAMASVGVFNQLEDGRFEATPASELLRDEPGSLRATALFSGAPWCERPWGELMYSVRTGKSAFEKAMGKPIWEYLSEDPEGAAIFDATMVSQATQTHRAVVEAYDFSGIRKLVDVGGGHGALMSMILERYPEMTGAVIDRPPVIEGTKKLLEERGLSDRCEAVGGSFFEEVPTGDAYIFSTMLHNWDDEDAVRILKNVRRAMSPEGRGLLMGVELVVPEGNEHSVAKFMDLDMLIMTPAGRCRTEEEFRQVFEAAGFRLNRVLPTRAASSLLESTRI